jgi:hypothetical protein
MIEFPPELNKSVIYSPPGRYFKEEGIITGFNEAVVFVRYRGDLHSKATRYEDLIYALEVPQ